MFWKKDKWLNRQLGKSSKDIELEEKQVIYDVNTGFGALSNIRLSPQEIARAFMRSSSNRVPRFRKTRRGMKIAYSMIRKAVLMLRKDKVLSEDIENIENQLMN